MKTHISVYSHAPLCLQKFYLNVSAINIKMTLFNRWCHTRKIWVPRRYKAATHSLLKPVLDLSSGYTRLLRIIQSASQSHVVLLSELKSLSYSAGLYLCTISLFQGPLKLKGGYPCHPRLCMVCVCESVWVCVGVFPLSFCVCCFSAVVFPFMWRCSSLG